MSKTSRSSQLAAGQMPDTDGTASPSAARVFIRTRCRRRGRIQAVDDVEPLAARAGQSTAVTSEQ